MANEILIRTYRPEDLQSLETMINEADAHDKLERATTLQEMEHEMSFPTVSPETDCFLAWAGDRLVGYADIYVRKGDPKMDKETTLYCWGVVHPQWRRRGVAGACSKRPIAGVRSIWPRSRCREFTSTAILATWKRTVWPCTRRLAWSGCATR